MKGERRKNIKKFMKNSYKIALMALCGTAACSSIVTNAEKVETIEPYEQSVKVNHKYFVNYGFEEVILSYESMISSGTASAEGFLDAAATLTDAGDLDKALELVLKAIGLYPENKEAYLKAIEIYTRLGDTQRAEEIRRNAYDATGDSQFARKAKIAAKAAGEQANKPESVVTNMLKEAEKAETAARPETSYGDSQGSTGGYSNNSSEASNRKKPAQNPASTPRPTPTPDLTPTPELLPDLTPTPEPLPDLTPTPEPLPDLTPTPEPTPDLTPTPEPTPDLTPMPE